MAKNRRDAGDLVDRVLGELWATIAAGDVLNAEIQTAEFVSLPELSDASAHADKLAAALIEAASTWQYGPVGAAFLRLLMALGSRAIRRAASEALAEFTSNGIYPPDWVARIGKPAPGAAWRAYDVFGDREAIIVTFSYPGAEEHALLVGVDLFQLPAISLVVVSPDTAGLLTTMRGEIKPYERFEQITLADARQRIETPLAQAGTGPGPELDGSLAYLPLARSRVRRLPASEPRRSSAYTSADRDSAVGEFLRSPWAADAGDQETARFWAEVLTGYSSRVPGERPGQAGPEKLAAMLLVHVASTFTLSAQQHASLRPTVTAWVRWAASRQQLDEAATDRLMERLPRIFDQFAAAYDDPHNVASRGYLRDIARSDAGAALLADQRARRETAAPPADDRDPSVMAADATDPAGRAALLESEFATCMPDGAAGEDFLAAATRVVEELWHDDPPETWREAKRLMAAGLDRHDVIHALAGTR